MTGQRLVPGPQGTRFSLISHVAETGSTNADLLLEAAAGAAEGAVRVTDHQNAGRGRQARVWHDEPGNSMLMSVLLRPAPPLASLMPLLAGLAVGDGVAQVMEEVGVVRGSTEAEWPVALKWPNDVLVPSLGERKLAGILTEATSKGAPAGHLGVVAGAGLNLRWGSEPPAEIAQRAATLEELAGAPIDRWAAVANVLAGYEKWLRVAESRGPTEGAALILDAYRQRCCTLHRSVRLERQTDVVEGTAVGIADTGALIIETTAGLVEVTAGDAHHI